MTTMAQPPIGDNPEIWLEDGPRLEQKKFSIFDMLLVVARQKWLVLLTGLVFALIALIPALTSPPMYKSTVTFMPPEETASRGAGGSLQDLSAALASSAGATFKTSEEFWASILRGRSIGEDVVNNFHLIARYKADNMTAARAKLDARTGFDIDRAGLISITVSDVNAQAAADIANGYIGAMHRLMDTMSLTDAQERRNFFTRELNEQKEALAQAEFNLTQVEKRNGVISLGGQTSEALRQVSDLRAQITSKNLQLQSLRTSATDNNPEVIRLKNEIVDDQAELDRQEKLQISNHPGEIGASSVPEATLENIRATREVRFHETLYEALARQLEASLMDIAREAPIVQVIDDAVPPQKHSGLPGFVLVVAAFLAGLAVGVVLAIIRQMVRNVAASDENGPKLRQLKDALRLGA